MQEILEILERDSRSTAEQIAVMLGKTEAEVKAAIKLYEENKVILGYKTLINWEKTDKEFITAHIELKVTPQRGEGFDKIAERIYKYPQVKALSLMSGGYDLSVTVEGKSLKDVAMFVSEKLSLMEGVVSTSTHFVLKKYKDEGVIFSDGRQDTREVITL